MSNYLDHEKLEVYRFAIQFVVLADEIVENFPRGRAYLADQPRELSLRQKPILEFTSVYLRTILVI